MPRFPCGRSQGEIWLRERRISLLDPRVVGSNLKISPDGKYLVYGTRYQTQTGLRIRNLKTGSDDWLIYPIVRDDQESRFTRDVLPTYDFTPNSRELVFTKDGGFHRINLKTRTVKNIPFNADVILDVGPELNFPFRISDNAIESRIIMDPVISPNGRDIVFSTFMHLF